MTYNEYLLYKKIDELEAELGEQASVFADLVIKNKKLSELLNRYYTGSIQFEAV